MNERRKAPKNKKNKELFGRKKNKIHKMVNGKTFWFSVLPSLICLEKRRVFATDKEEQALK